MKKVNVLTSTDRTPLIKLLKQYSQSELTEFYKYLGLTGSKLKEILAAGLDHKKLPRLISLYLGLQKVLNFENIFWEEEWILYKIEQAAGNYSLKLNQDYLRNQGKIYLWIEKPLKSGVYYLFNIEKLNVKSTIQEACKNMIGFLDGKQAVAVIKNSFKENSEILDEIKNYNIRLYKILFPAYVIKEFVSSHEEVLTASLTCSREISGTAGIEKIVFHGSNVGKGLTELNRRQEIDLSKLGSWSEIQTRDLYLSVEGKIRFRDYNKLLEFVKNAGKDLIRVEN